VIGVGAILLDLGWGVVGYCPGPVLTSLRLGRGEALLFVAAILAGRGRAIAFGDTVAFLSSVIPAEAGIQRPKTRHSPLDSRLRGCEEIVRIADS